MTNNRLLNNLIWIIFLISLFSFGYYKYQETNNKIITTNYGAINLGKVFEEKIYISTSIQGLFDDSKEYIPLPPQSFLDGEENIHRQMEEKFKILNEYSSKKETINYSEASPKVDMNLKIETYIAYRSENFNNEPFNFQISEKTYTIRKNKNMKSEISRIISENYDNNKVNVSESLFLTDPKKIGLTSDDEKS